jgi:hypothetical protein
MTDPDEVLPPETAGTGEPPMQKLTDELRLSPVTSKPASRGHFKTSHGLTFL